MTENQWAEDGQDKPLRKQLPKWVWFCGGGCVLAVIATVVILFFIGRMVQKAADPEHGWAELQKILPADDVHPDHEAHAFPTPGIDMVTVIGPDETVMQFQRHTGVDAEKVTKELFEGDKPQFPENVVVMKFTDLEKADVKVQGRTLRGYRMKGEITGIMRTMAGKEAAQADQYMMFIDVTPEGRKDEVVLLHVQRPSTKGQFSDAELETLLAPFHIGPKR